MKKLLLIITLLAGAAVVSLGQTSPVTGSVEGAGPRAFVGAPTGSCTTLQTAVNASNGDFYDCNVGTWNKVNGAGGTPTQTNITGATDNVMVKFSSGNLVNSTCTDTGTLITCTGTGGVTYSGTGNQITSTQGTLGSGGAFTSAPFLSHTVTWNTTSAVGDDLRTITCTAAGAGSSALKVFVGANPIV
jgi:hypothetical protein